MASLLISDVVFFVFFFVSSIWMFMCLCCAVLLSLSPPGASVAQSQVQSNRAVLSLASGTLGFIYIYACVSVCFGGLSEELL